MIKRNFLACSRCRQQWVPLTINRADYANASILVAGATLDFISKTHYQYLCISCLLELNAMVTWSQTHPFSERVSEMEPGIHFYLEGPYHVFTERYHIQRGYCCGSGCRHCAYGFKCSG